MFAVRRVPQVAPGRLVTGAFVLHSGWEKWKGSVQQAEGVHASAAAAFPFLRSVAPTTFLRALSVGEITVGTLLLTPVVPNRVAGGALTGFAAALLTFYGRAPGLRRPGSIWPTPEGIGVSKDAWMLGIGLELVTSEANRDR